MLFATLNIRDSGEGFLYSPTGMPAPEKYGPSEIGIRDQRSFGQNWYYVTAIY
jgi:hypothetical protein